MLFLSKGNVIVSQEVKKKKKEKNRNKKLEKTAPIMLEAMEVQNMKTYMQKM